LHLETAQAIVRTPDFVSFVLLRAEPGAAATLANRLQAAQPSLSVLTRDELSKNDRRILGELFIQPINVMSTAGFLVGLAIVGLTMYTTTAERLRDFGVLKAIGASNAYLFRTVVTQAIVLGLTGFALGFAAAELAGPVIVRFVPDIGIDVRMAPALRALASVLAMSLAGAIVPVARIVRVDPLIVFRR
jgi:putative ABC transport system permease protein